MTNLSRIFWRNHRRNITYIPKKSQEELIPEDSSGKYMKKYPEEFYNEFIKQIPKGTLRGRLKSATEGIP